MQASTRNWHVRTSIAALHPMPRGLFSQECDGGLSRYSDAEGEAAAPTLLDVIRVPTVAALLCELFGWDGKTVRLVCSTLRDQVGFTRFCMGGWIVLTFVFITFSCCGWADTG
jgi:hypothetical protein